MTELVRAGNLSAPLPVRKEAARKSELLRTWFDAVPELFVETSDLWDAAREITLRFPRLVDDTVPGEAADPWLIALALRIDGSRGLFDPPTVVVSEERRRAGSTISRIEEVCDRYSLEHTDHVGMLELAGWTFGPATSA